MQAGPYPPANTSPEPTATADPQSTGSPILPICLPFTNTVLDPAARLPPCGAQVAHPCGAQLSPCRCTAMPFTNTSGLPAVEGRAGKHPWPVQSSPFRVTAGISSNQS
eukprot:GHVU01014946.1.p1 GENE.GHVU01014946.1~~GHVU01014946.1.p1  ORF type:complete len:108 (+),score=0.29 GHVU01014946.1:360-683(+)